MFAKRFFYVCAGLLCLALAYHLGARNAGAQLPGSYQEVAMLSGQVADGGTIPLPHYADGTEAQESECYWMASPRTLENVNGNSKFERCSTDGRLVRAYWCYGSCGPAGDCVPMPPGCLQGAFPGTANYLIIAVRNTGPIPVRPETIGRLKARYRTR